MNRLHTPFFGRVVPALAFALGLVTTAGAQTSTPAAAPAKPAAEEAVSLSVFEVTTSKDIGYQSTNAAEVTRMNTPIENIPMNVTVLNQQFIEDLLATDSSQLLAYDVSSVKTSENDGFMARGSASVGTNFLNGFAQTGGFGSQPLANIERVEVIRGPAAVLYGSGGYGGTYNRITKQPQARTFTNARTIASDRASFRTEADFNRPLPLFGGKKFFFRVNGIFDRGYTWFGQRKKEDGLAPSLRWDVGPKTKLILEYFYNWRESQASWETPLHLGDPHGMTVGNGTYRTMPRKIAWVSPDDYRRNLRRVYATDLRHAFTDNLQFRSQFQFENRAQNNVETVAASDGLVILKDTALMARIWRSRPQNTDNYRVRNEVVWNVKTGPFSHRLLFGQGWLQIYDFNTTIRSSQNYGGMTGTRLTGDGKITDASSSAKYFTYADLSYAAFLANPQLAGFNTNLLLPINLFDRGLEPVTPAVDLRSPLWLDTRTRTYTCNQDLYANDVVSFWRDRFFVMAGVRQAHYARKTIAYASGTFPNKVLLASAPTTYVTADAATSSYGAVWHLTADKTVSLYANLNSSFSPTYTVQPDGSELKPEEGRQKEVGVRFSLLGGRMSGLVTWFDILQNNVTQADPTPGRTGYYIQVNGQHSTGMEYSINGRITDNWLVMGGLSDTDARNDLTGVAKDLQPRFRGTLFNRYSFTRGMLKGLNLSLGAVYTGARDLTNANARNEPNWGPLPAWWRFDTIASYKFKYRRTSCDLSLKVNNLLDNRDIYYVGSWFRYTIDAGRDWQAVAGVRF
jgi:outer membrane receptor protein involved in Fe transport